MSSGAAKRPAPGDAGGGAPPAAKRPAGGSSAAPAFLDDDDGDDEDMPWMDDAVDAELAELQGSTDGVRAHWLRPALPPLEPSGDAVGETSFPSHAFVCCVSRDVGGSDACCAEFQQMDIDTIVGPPHAEWMRGAPPQVAIIRMFGVTAAGARTLLKCSCPTLLTLPCRASQEIACAATYTAFSRTSTPRCRPTLLPTTSRRFAKS